MYTVDQTVYKDEKTNKPILTMKITDKATPSLEMLEMTLLSLKKKADMKILSYQFSYNPEDTRFWC